jgi:hypothetical protein
LVTQSNTLSLAMTFGPDDFVFSLPHADRVTAKDFIRKLLPGLGNYWCHYGLATYPEDGTNAEALVNRAWEQCVESRGTDSGNHESESLAA